MPRLLRKPNAGEQILVAATIFLGALLLFAVQPLIAKIILPWFGGAAGVWLACLVFFQAALLAGYLYAHLLTRTVAHPFQWRVHLGVLALSLLFLPIIPAEVWKPLENAAPLALILMLLSATVGVPFLVLASTGPLVQAWMSRRHESANPSVYRLYALSNVGSLLALLSYPILIEPWLSTDVHAWCWSSVYFVFAMLSASVAWRYRNAIAEKSTPGIEPGDRVDFADRLLWFVLAALPSALLLAATNHMLRNIAAIPLLWIVPLSLYLLSFIVAFDNPRWYYRPLWYGVLPLAIGTILLSVAAPLLSVGYIAQLVVQAGALFICCMVCHGELAWLKPAPRGLTSYYLTIAGGGAAGGLSIAVIAPAIFAYDLDLAIVLLVLTAFVGFLTWWRLPPHIVPSWVRVNSAFLILGVWTAVLAIPLRSPGRETLIAVRNFYGPLQVNVTPANDAGGEYLELRNGNIMHGRESTTQGSRCEPLSYYGRASGVGVAIQEASRSGPLKIGVIGLGAGTIAGYARVQDAFRFYELNPLVATIAGRDFQYLACAESTSVALGDARLSLEREAPNEFDILAVDAFTSDAIPVHLLTREAFAVYWRHIKEGGVLAVHVSNRYVDLAPIVARAAAESGHSARLMTSSANANTGVSSSDWVLVAEKPGFFAVPAFRTAKPIEAARGIPVWTDNYSNVWRALKW